MNCRYLLLVSFCFVFIFSGYSNPYSENVQVLLTNFKLNRDLQKTLLKRLNANRFSVKKPIRFRYNFSKSPKTNEKILVKKLENAVLRGDVIKERYLAPSGSDFGDRYDRYRFKKGYENRKTKDRPFFMSLAKSEVARDPWNLFSSTLRDPYYLRNDSYTFREILAKPESFDFAIYQTKDETQILNTGVSVKEADQLVSVFKALLEQVRRPANISFEGYKPFFVGVVFRKWGMDKISFAVTAANFKADYPLMEITVDYDLKEKKFGKRELTRTGF